MESILSLLSSNVSRHHVVTQHLLKGSNSESVPVLWLFQPDSDEPQLFTPLLDYFVQLHGMSNDWRRKCARSIGLFYDFCIAPPANEAASRRNTAKDVKGHFVKALKSGTIPADGSVDRTGLYWSPTPTSTIKVYLSHLDGFTEYLQDSTTTEDQKASKAEWLTNTGGLITTDADLKKFFVAAKLLKERSFLGHLKRTGEVAQGLRASCVNFGRDNVYDTPDERSVVSMEPDLVTDLMTVGFVKDPNSKSLFDREDVTAKMVFMLLAYGGLRVSEPFHLWFNDIVIEDLDGRELCYPHLRHPSQARTFILGEAGNREDYLHRRGHLPRHLLNHGSLKAGWKGIMTDNMGQAPVFFLHENLHPLFISYYQAYLIYRRELVSHWVRMGNQDHPWLFVSKGFDNSKENGSMVGSPYTINSFSKALQRAIDRVERYRGFSISRGKNYGTTPHALRHFYAQALRRANADSAIIKRALHHRSIFSQNVYTVPTNQEVSETLNRLIGKTDIELDKK